jgi:uncharacterized repeat protein (TIGR01451 family)
MVMSMVNESPEKKDRRDLLLLLLIVLLAFVCMFVAGTLATRLAPDWMLETNMDSGINPDDLYTPQIGYIAPINESILTRPVDDSYLTPGTQPPTQPPLNVTPTPTGVPRTKAPSPTAVNTIAATATTIVAPSPTATLFQPPSLTPPPPPTKTPEPSADLTITKTDGMAFYTPGGQVTYTIRVSNAGPDDVTGATVTDTFPAKISSAVWTCTAAGGGSCTASGSGDFSDSIDLPMGGTVTYTVIADIRSSATGQLRNTASVALPAGITDPDGSDNAATDVDAPAYSADLSILKDDGVTTYTPGGSLTYIIQISNAGPSDVIGGTVSDRFPALIASTTWSCAATGGGSCTPSGTGDISDTIDLPAGESLTYTVVASVRATATGPLTNTASVAVPAGVTDPDGSNNSDSDTDNATADLAITKVADVPYYTPGGPITYTIQVSNAGPSDVTGATVSDAFPAEVSNPPPSWTCAAPGGASCSASGTGDINDTINLPVGGTVTYTVNVVVDSGASSDILNTASVSPPSGTSDPNTGNNSSTVTTPPTTCTLAGVQITIPANDSCSLNRPSLGTNGNLYTLTNTDVGSVTIIWYGLGENQTGTCGFQDSPLGLGNTLTRIAVADFSSSGNTILVFNNPTVSSITITILEELDWSTGSGCFVLP